MSCFKKVIAINAILITPFVFYGKDFDEIQEDAEKNGSFVQTIQAHSFEKITAVFYATTQYLPTFIGFLPTMHPQNKDPEPVELQSLQKIDLHLQEPDLRKPSVHDDIKDDVIKDDENYMVINPNEQAMLAKGVTMIEDYAKAHATIKKLLKKTSAGAGSVENFNCIVTAGSVLNDFDEQHCDHPDFIDYLSSLGEQHADLMLKDRGEE